MRGEHYQPDGDIGGERRGKQCEICLKRWIQRDIRAGNAGTGGSGAEKGVLLLAFWNRLDGGVVMAFFTDVMTVYNYRRDVDGEHWARSVIRGVQWRHGKRRVSADKGVFTDEPEESVTVDFTRTYQRNPLYVSPQEYASLEDKGGFWTLNPADGTDFIVCGEVAQEIGDGYSISQLKKDFDAYVIVSVSDNRNRNRLKHIRVVAK
nr:MAG TPA: hypothetical protein [Siphoviridae sp. ctH3Y19]